MYWSQCPADIRFWPILGKWNWYNRSKYKDFWMGPSVKFGSFPKKVMGKFFSEKKAKRGGSEGGLSKGDNFSVFFPGTFPLMRIYLKFSAVAVKVFLRDLWSIYLSFSGRQDKGNGSQNKGSKDPKCAASNEARAVGAIGVVYPTHLGKTKTMS